MRQEFWHHVTLFGLSNCMINIITTDTHIIIFIFMLWRPRRAPQCDPMEAEKPVQGLGFVTGVLAAVPAMALPAKPQNPSSCSGAVCYAWQAHGCNQRRVCPVQTECPAHDKSHKAKLSCKSSGVEFWRGQYTAAGEP